MTSELATPTFISPVEQAQNLSSELKEELVLLRPTRNDERRMSTEHGDREVRDVEALIVLGENDYRNLGEISIFWEVVRNQLPDKNQWIAGRIMREKKAYHLQAAMIEELGMLQSVLSKHTISPIPVEHPATEDENEAPY